MRAAVRAPHQMMNNRCGEREHIDESEKLSS